MGVASSCSVFVSGEEDAEGEAPTLAAKLVAASMPAVLSAFNEAKQAAFTLGAEARRRARERVQQEVEGSLANFQLFSRALPLFEEDKSLQVRESRP